MSMTECELSSFKFVPIGLQGDADKPRDLSASDVIIFAGFRVMRLCLISSFTLGFAETCFASDVAQLH